jgi:hypothetical protein
VSLRKEVTVDDWLLAVSYWLLAIGYWLLAIGCWLLAVGYCFSTFNLKPYPSLSLGAPQRYNTRTSTQNFSQEIYFILNVINYYRPLIEAKEDNQCTFVALIHSV